MQIMSTLIILLFITLAASSQQAHSQDMKSRGSDKGDGVAQSHTIYNQKHLSPHRMMHFGKRPLVQSAPLIQIPADLNRAIDLYQQQQPANLHRSIDDPLADYPYMFSIELQHGQTLQSVPEDAVAYEAMAPLIKNLLYSYDRRPHEQQAATPRAQFGQRLMKLMEASDNDFERANNNNNNNNNADEQPQEQSGDSQDQTFSVSSRSVPMTQTFNLPKSYISRLLFGGRPTSVEQTSLLAPAGLNKKAESKSNLFMHFG